MDDDNNDVDSSFATFGMVYSELIEILAAIRISTYGLREVLKTEKHLSKKEIALILVAIENNDVMYDMLSLGGTIPQKEVMQCVRQIYAKVDLLNQMEFLRGNLIQKDVPRKEKTLITFIEEPDPLVKELYGDEGC